MNSINVNIPKIVKTKMIFMASLNLITARKTNSIKVSVVIVTFNRPEDCKKTIESLLIQSIQPHEIIVIDDYSIKPFSYNHPLVKILRNNYELGLGASRNRGIRSSRGNVVAFIDDDAIASPNWIEIIHYAFNSNVDIVGGPVVPVYLKHPPKWWDEKQFSMPIAISDDHIIGCNFAVKKNLFKKIGYFNPRLGRKKGILLSGEESEFLKRASVLKVSIKFEPKMIVHHKVYPYRMSMPYLLKRFWWEGITYFMISPISHVGMLKNLAIFLMSLLKVILFLKNKRKWLLISARYLGSFFAMFKFKNQRGVLSLRLRNKV